jgi:hypothetical protein
VIQEVALDGGADPEAFLEQAVAFANDKCWGTLACGCVARAPPSGGKGGAGAEQA